MEDASSTADYNVCIGSIAGFAMQADNSVAIGYQAAKSLTTGDNTTAVGRYALKDTTTGSGNVAVGLNAMEANTAGSNNTAVGTQALEVNTTSNNVAVGYQALKANTTGGQNTAIGFQNLLQNTTGTYNTTCGYLNLYACTDGSYNTGIGWRTMEHLTGGSQNVALGRAAGQYITTGSYNISIGSIANGWTTTNKTGDFNIHIGYATNPSAASVSNEIVIATGNDGATGRGTGTFFVDNVSNGVFNSANGANWNTTSDQRIKKNIVDNNTGLDILNQIQVRNFEYRTEEEIVDFDNPAAAVVNKEGLQLGVVAQEIETILPEIVETVSTGVKTVNPDNLTWYLVNAVKELSAENTALKARLDAAGL